MLDDSPIKNLKDLDNTFSDPYHFHITFRTERVYKSTPRRSPAVTRRDRTRCMGKDNQGKSPRRTSAFLASALRWSRISINVMTNDRKGWAAKTP